MSKENGNAYEMKQILKDHDAVIQCIKSDFSSYCVNKLGNALIIIIKNNFSSESNLQ